MLDKSPPMANRLSKEYFLEPMVFDEAYILKYARKAMINSDLAVSQHGNRKNWRPWYVFHGLAAGVRARNTEWTIQLANNVDAGTV